MITHGGNTYRVLDAHTHAFPDAIAPKAMEVLIRNANPPAYADGTYAGLCHYERRADKFLLLPIATRPQQAHSVNTWAASVMGRKLIAFGSVHPDSDHLKDELDEIVHLGLRGIKLHPEYQQFYVDEERNLRLYEMIFDRGLQLVFHAGVDGGYPPPVHCTPVHLKHVLDAFPNDNIIAAHMGGYKMEDEVSELIGGYPNLWLDMAYEASIIEPVRLARLARAHGVDRVLFATDSPWTDFDAAVDSVLSAGFNEDELRGILYDNAARLLGID